MKSRIAFLDYLRVVACLMVMIVHASEQFYFNGNGEFFIASRSDALWVTLFDSAVRVSVPLFVMASAYLLFPLTKPTGAFFLGRAKRVLIPFVLWCVVYTLRFGGDFTPLAFNFPMTVGGHLWFVPMLCGLYLLMPLLSPWAERASQREVAGWLALWLLTTTFPYLRELSRLVLGAPIYGAVPYLYGECPWNGFGAFHYVSGFFGYLLLGLFLRKFTPDLTPRQTVFVALPLGLVGYALVAGLFWVRLPGAYPMTRPYADAVLAEMSWEFCSLGVVLMTAAVFLVLRLCRGEGAFYRQLVRPVSEASYGAYLLHMLVLVEVAAVLKPLLPTPLAILSIAAVSFLLSACVALLLRRIPRVGPFLS